jgi:hypothetical protein
MAAGSELDPHVHVPVAALEAEAVILPGTLTIADEVTAGGVKSQSRLSFDSAHIAMVPLLLVQSYSRVDQARRPSSTRPS